jgi:hypothetical protein
MESVLLRCIKALLTFSKSEEEERKESEDTVGDAFLAASAWLLRR